MKRSKTQLLFLTLALVSLYLFRADAQAGEAFRVIKSKVLTQNRTAKPGGTLYIDLKNADISITGKQTNEIIVEATVEVQGKDEELLTEFLHRTSMKLRDYRNETKLTIKNPRDADYDTKQKGGLSRFLQKLLHRNEFGLSVS